MAELLEVENLSKVYERRILPWKKQTTVALESVSFKLASHSTLAIVGDTGSGKSTLAKLLGGAEQPSTGEIRLLGKKVHSGDHKNRCRNIRMIFQDPATSLNPSISIGQILEEPLKLNTQLTANQRQDRIRETLAMVGLLSDYIWHYPNMLSSGQRQRIALARALILQPKIIVADKPFAAMDPSTRSQMVNLFLQLQADLGLSYVFVSHNLNIVRHISDQLFVMEDGKVVERGDTQTILADPKQVVTKKLLYSQQMLGTKKG
ncbi:ATP-binding cassette domain-containing protein [Gayadomonas joobiniege]|uniref:peptide ABC transporter ATP-binding protein n=1 Tax=Gayadomonas joobiniege TaxID=1234606 RepID=UPI00035C98FF|nr:ABC transporter ATP-binding protein [Gayadomonas joobiniege]